MTRFEYIGGMETNTQPTVEVQKYRIPERNLSKLRDGFFKLAKRAAKLNVAAPVLVEGEHEIETLWSHVNVTLPTWSVVKPVLNGSADEYLDTGSRRLFVYVTVTGETPKLAGWSLLAVIEHLPGEGNIIRKVPTITEELPPQYREASNVCEHCGFVRNRKETFIVRHDDGTTKQIGRQCLVDFLGGVNPDALANGAEIIFSAAGLCSEFEEGGISVGRDGYGLIRFLAMTNACIREFGWTSRKTENEGGRSSTASDVAYQLDPPKDCDRSKLIHFTIEDEAFAQDAAEWAKSQHEGNAELNDYQHNINILARSGLVTWRHTGLAASIVNSYRRELGIVAERKHLSDLTANSQYVGAIGQRQDFLATVIKAIALESDYGPKTLYVFVDDKGNAIKWFASGNGAGSLDIGTTYSLNARVERHEEYKGTKTTQISRAKVNPTAEELAERAAAKKRDAAIKKEVKAERKAVVDAEAALEVAQQALNAAPNAYSNVPDWQAKYEVARAAHQAAYGKLQDAKVVYETAVRTKAAELFPK